MQTIQKSQRTINERLADLHFKFRMIVIVISIVMYSMRSEKWEAAKPNIATTDEKLN